MDFLKFRFKKRKEIEKRRRIFQVLAIFLVLFLLVICVLGLFGYSYYAQAKGIYINAQEGKVNLEKAQNSINDFDFESGLYFLELSQDNFYKAQNGLNQFNLFIKVPYIENKLEVAKDLVAVGINAIDALMQIAETVNELKITIDEASLVQEEFTEAIPEGDFSFASLSSAQKRRILKKFSQILPQLEQARLKINQALTTFREIPKEELIAPIKYYITPLEKRLIFLNEQINNATVLATFLPQVAGYPDEKKYLFLLQNNTELRPTGGFIGTYGILKLKDGEIKDFKTDNIYNLDRPSEGKLKVAPPDPLKKYLKIEHLFMRDANWSPDFATSAEKILWFYPQEYKNMTGSIAEEVDGVIAITPFVVKKALELTGPLNIEGEVFNVNNFLDKLQYIVEVEYAQKGIEESQRKEVINKIATQIKKKLFELPKSQWYKILDGLVESLNEKHILVYEKNNELAKLIEKENWDGRLRSGRGDFLMVVDSNLAALKTDQKIKRHINYNIYQKNGDYYGKVKIRYNHLGDFDWKTTRLRSYTRVYVPKGSALINYKGAMKDDKTKEKGEVDSWEELNKTVFGAFISVEPKESKELIFEYKLPEYITKRIKAGTYEFLAQKQPGTIDHNLTLSLDFDKTLKSATPGELKEKWYDDIYELETDLKVDREIFVEFR